MDHFNTLLQEGAVKLQREQGRGVRDIESDIFPRRSLNIDYEGDTLHYMGMERQARLTNRQKLRRVFHNASMAKKNAIRKIRKELKKVGGNAAKQMVKNMKPMHLDDMALKFDNRLRK